MNSVWKLKIENNYGGIKLSNDDMGCKDNWERDDIMSAM